MTGLNINGNHKNSPVANGSGGGQIATATPATAPAPKKPGPLRRFDQGVVLRQSPQWSKAIIISIMSVTVFGVAWAAIARIEQVVPAQGQLKPQGQVQEIKPPVNGVVKEVYVKEGDRVEKGQLLILLDPTASQAELQSLEQIHATLKQENQFFDALMKEPLGQSQIEAAITRLQLPREVASLARNRSALMAENDLFQAQLGNQSAVSLDLGQLERLRAAREELNSRVEAARLEMEQLGKQLNQNQAQLSETQTQLQKDRQVLAEISDRNRLALAQAQESLALEERLLVSLEPLVNEGAIAKLQVERQRQEVNDRRATLVQQSSDGQIEFERQQQQIESRLGEIERLQEEQQRLRLDVAQAQQEITNTKALTNNEILTRIADNQKRIAELDSQLTRLLLDNQRRIAELDSQISRTRVTLNYQELRAPVTGKVFDLKAVPGFVPQPSQAEALLKIVPEDNLIAEVYVTNKDIGFVAEGQKADVRIDSFPFSEFGDIKGKVTAVGDDALEPDQMHQFYRFPTEVELDSQQLITKAGESIPLQSGMSISVNIKVRENRTVLSLFTELFTNKTESLKKVR